MAESQNLIAEAIIKYAHGEVLTEREAVLLQEWYAQSPGNWELLESYRNDPELAADLKELLMPETDDAWEEVIQFVREDKEREEKAKKAKGKIQRIYKIAGWTVAAAVVISISVALVLRRNPKVPDTARQNTIPLKAPPKIASIGSDTASQVLLITANGIAVVLDTVPTGGRGRLDESTWWKKTGEDEMVCEGTGPTKDLRLMHQLLVGTRRRRFNLQSLDSSKLGIRSGSSIRYSPYRETNREEPQYAVLNGNVYFSIAKDEKIPVRIQTLAQMSFKVLGTRFSVDAGVGVEPKVQLISGALKAYGPEDSALVKPGTQMVLADRRLKAQALSDAAGLFAWAKLLPFFRFKNIYIDEAAREIAEFYSMDVYNPDNIRWKRFTAERLARDRSVEGVLNDIQFMIGSDAIKIYPEGGRIVIARRSKS